MDNYVGQRREGCVIGGHTFKTKKGRMLRGTVVPCVVSNVWLI